MKAVGITPQQPHTARLVDLPMPRLVDVPGGRGVLGGVALSGSSGRNTGESSDFGPITDWFTALFRPLADFTGRNSDR